MGVYKHVHKGLIVLVPEEIGVWAKLSPESKSKLVLRLLSRELLPVSWYSVENGSPIVIDWVTSSLRLKMVFNRVKNFISYWYLQYLLATSVYMLEPIERRIFSILLFTIRCSSLFLCLQSVNHFETLGMKKKTLFNKLHHFQN